MSRQQSPSIPPEAAYIEESSTPSIPAQSSYYEASTQRQLMTDEMMDDISRIAGAGQSSDLLNGQNHHALSSILQATTSNAPDPTSPMTPTQQEQPPLSAHDSLSQQRQSYRLDSASSDQYADGGNKRKRSKVSRACDECRRKKIRCDATKDDGTVETCSNCKRINTTCAFSRQPMKRGPSKGYIKELSERVQQVENQMETQRSLSQMGPPVGFRSSLDGRQSLDSNAAGLFETNYSPSEPSFSKKRTYSAMSEGNISANPFAQPQYTSRDRMPSHSWSLTTSPQNYSQTARFSIAIAPDQMPDLSQPPSATTTTAPPSTTTPKSAKPFWTEFTEHTSQQKKLTTRQDEISIPVEDRPGYEHYLKSVHPILPLLPSLWDAVERHLRNCSDQQLIEAFTKALSLSQQADNEQVQTEISGIIFSQLRTPPKEHTQSSNFVSSWLCSLLYVHISSDITPQKQVDKQYILQHLVDILLHLIQDLETDNTNIEASKSDVNSDRNLARRAFNVIATLARLYSLGAGLEDDLIPNNERVLSLIGENDDVAMMSDATAVLTRYAQILSPLLDTPYITTPAGSTRLPRQILHLLTSQLRDIHVSRLPDPMSPLACQLTTQLDLLVHLILSRNLLPQASPFAAPIQILANAEAAVGLLSQMQAEALTTGPVTQHLCVLAGMTFLEFAAALDPTTTTTRSDPEHLPGKDGDNDDDDNIITFALEPLKDLLNTLNKIQENTTLTNTDDNNSSPHPSSWSSALKHLILSRHPNIAAPPPTTASETEKENDTNPNDLLTNGDDDDANITGDKFGAAKKKKKEKTDMLGGWAATPIRLPDFTLLAREGWISVLGDLTRNSSSSSSGDRQGGSVL